MDLADKDGHGRQHSLWVDDMLIVRIPSLLMMLGWWNEEVFSSEGCGEVALAQVQSFSHRWEFSRVRTSGRMVPLPGY